MRSFFAGLAIFLSFLTGTTALASYVIHDVVLDPARAGEVVAYGLQQTDLRRDILGHTVPRYGRLSVKVRADVDAVAESSGVGEAARRVSLDSDGNVALGPLQQYLARVLRPDHPSLATRIAGADTRVAVPSRYVDRYDAARDNSRTLAVRGALATAVLLVVALLVTPSRRRSSRSIGIAALLAAGIVALGYWALPTVIQAASSSSVVGAVVAVVRAERTDVLLRVAPVAVVGAVLVVVAVALGSRSRRS